MTKNQYNSVHSILLQATSFCNINCSYCYLANRNHTNILHQDILNCFLDELEKTYSLSSPPRFCWHLGEPLAVGHAHFSKLCHVIRSRPALNKAAISLQTNATLIDERWVQLFKQLDIDVSFSLDGPEELHNQNRKYRSGVGAFKATIKGVQHLKAAGIPLYVICVLTPAHLQQWRAIYTFFKQLGVSSLAFNIEQSKGAHQLNSTDNYQDFEQELKRFYQNFLALLVADKWPFNVREFREAYGKLNGTHASGIICQSVAGSMLALTTNGGVGTFSPDLVTTFENGTSPFTLGNITSNTLVDILQSEKCRTIKQDIYKGIMMCRDQCRYFEHCGGGIPLNKYFENGRFDSTQTHYCRNSIQIPLMIMEEAIQTYGAI